MLSFEGLFFILFFCAAVYSFYYEIKGKEKAENRDFDNRVLGFIDGLRFPGIDFKCTNYDLHQYIEEQLALAYKLRRNQFLVEYTTSQGWHYTSYTGKKDYALFAILCIAEYAKNMIIQTFRHGANL